MSDKLAQLTKIGFMHAGVWRLAGNGLAYDISDTFAKTRNVLYAFAVDGALVYVGKTTVPLHVRFQRYKTPAKIAVRGGGTNIKNNRNIREALWNGSAVDVYVLHNAVQQLHGGFVVNFAASLEDSLVGVLCPPWNGRQQALPGATANPAPVIVPPLAVASAVAVASPTVQMSQQTLRVTAADFRVTLAQLMSEAAGSPEGSVDVRAGQLHRRVGGYPGKKHVMPVCCRVMYAAMRDGDLVVAQPPKGNGASLTIRYRLPRV